jgi:hypothetical protein
MICRREELTLLLDFLAESVLEMSDEDLLAEVREEGEEPEVVAQRVTTIIDDAIAKVSHEKTKRE